MIAKLRERGKNNGRADEEHRLVLQRGHDDFMRRPDAIDVRWTIRDAEIARIHHAQVDVEGLPELPGAPGSRLRPRLPAGVGPLLPNAFTAFNVLATVFVKSSDIRLEPRIEHGDGETLEDLAYAIAPAELLFHGARGHTVPRP